MAQKPHKTHKNKLILTSLLTASYCDFLSQKIKQYSHTALLRGSSYINVCFERFHFIWEIGLNSLSAHMFLFCFCPWPYILNVTLFSKNFVNIFSIALHVFSNSFWKICPLFGQILITCLKCFRASFSLSSYSEKMRWGRGWIYEPIMSTRLVRKMVFSVLL